jgi:hypothetical protein
MPKESSKSSIYGERPIDRNYSSISERLWQLIEVELGDRKSKFSELEKRTKVERNSWIQWHRRSFQSEPAARLIQAAALEWPQYAFWLVTGYTDPASGHVRPANPTGGKSGRHDAILSIQIGRAKQHEEIGKITREYFKFSIDLIRQIYGEETEVERIASRTETWHENVQRTLDALLILRCQLSQAEISELIKTIKNNK